MKNTKKNNFISKVSQGPAIGYFITILFLFVFNSFLQAQTVTNTTTEPSVNVINTFDQKILIEFTPDSVIENLLIVITDANGNTVFLDNQFRFTGRYKKEVDLYKNGKGDYEVNLTLDDKKINKKITIK